MSTIHTSKRKTLARFCQMAGLTTVMGRVPQRPGLLVLNYHRIGEAHESTYDRALFSATATEFDEQVGYLKKRYRIATLDEIIHYADRPQSLRGTKILLTFDDGYLDNYHTAWPILKSHGVSAVFFLPTAFIGTCTLPWWDVVAYLVRKTRKPYLRLTCFGVPQFRIPGTDRDDSIRALLQLYKAHSRLNSAAFIVLLRDACEVELPKSPASRVFLNWSEAGEMVRSGMDIGSHTHSHEVLAKLPEEEQYLEIVRSRDIIEERLGMSPLALSYPVGGPASFTVATCNALSRAAFRLGFSFTGYVNRPKTWDRFRLSRVSVSGCTPEVFRLRVAASLCFGKSMI